MTAVLRHLLNSAAEDADTATAVILRLLRDSFYVDDSVTSVADEAEGAAAKAVGIRTLEEAGMELRKRRSNVPELSEKFNFL